MEHDGVELAQPVFELHRLVGLEEEPRVGEPGAHHPLVARGDREPAVACDEVRGQDEGGSQRVGPDLPEHEALLVGADRRPHRLAGNLQEGFVEGSEQHNGPFHEPGDLLQQSLVLDEVETAGEGEVAGVVQDDVLAPVRVEDDVGALQGLDVVVEAADLDRAGREEAVAIGRGAGLDPIDRERHHVRSLGLGAEGRDDRLQRAHPAQGAGLRRGRTPAHRFRPGEAADDLRQDLSEHVEGEAAGALDDGHIELPLLRVGDDGGLIEARQSRALEEALDGALRRADTGAFALLAHVRPTGGEPGDVQREAARCREGLGALVQGSAFDQRIGDELPEVVGRTPLHAGGDLFGAQFEEEVRHGIRRRPR